MLQTKAVFKRKDAEIEPIDCVIDKVIHLSGAEFDRFSHGLMREWDFLRDNPIDTVVDGEGRYHCLLVVGEGRRDGILVNAEGAGYARYSAFMPNAEDLLTVGRYPALAELNKKLADIVDVIAEQVGAGNSDGRGVVDLQKWDALLGIELSANGALLNTLLKMLDGRPEIIDYELYNGVLTVSRNPEPVPVADDLSDPTISRTDMYAYGYGWEGMIPLGKERALELFDKGHEVFRLYGDDAEGAADSRDDIESFDGLFGVEDPAWAEPEREPPLQAFILNREKNDRGEAAGEWLALPTDVNAMCSLFERIGIDRPSEGAFTVTAIRVRDDCVRGHVSKYDSLDELNMLASYMESAADWYDFEKFQAILSSGIADVGSGAVALINLLETNNIECFELIDAKDAESLARHYHGENDEKPDGVSFEDYGKECVKEEGGRFTEWGYVKQKYSDFTQRYNGVVPEEYQITGMALHALRLGKAQRGTDEKPSVMERIRAAQQAPRQPRKDTPDKSKRKGGPEL